MQNNMALAVVSLVVGVLCGCLIGSIPGIVAVVFASQVRTKYAMGDAAGATRSARLARTWAIVGFAVTAGLLVLSLIGGFVDAFTTTS
jgi:hypothetical protein